MVRKSMIAAASAAALTLSATAFAQQPGGTADEAKAMLMKAAAAVKADKAKAIDMFNKGEGGFLDGDLYVFCVNLGDAKIVAVGNPNAKQLIGTDARTFKDATGKIYGPDIFAAMQKPEGQITEISYMFPKPGADKTPAPKVSLVTRASDDLGCGVGYYK
jgi:Single Cache domain 2